MSKTAKKSRASSPDCPTLQPLRIPTGWDVRWNTFFEVEAKFHSHDKKSWWFDEDMLLLVNRHRGVAIDLGWYPMHRANGSFTLMAVRHVGEGSPEDWDRPLKKLRTRSKQKIVQILEKWLQHYSDSPSPERSGPAKGGRRVKT